MVITRIFPTELLSVEVPDNAHIKKFNSFDDSIDSYTKIRDGEYKIIGTVTKKGVNFNVANYFPTIQTFYRLLFENGCFRGSNKRKDLLIIIKK